MNVIARAQTISRTLHEKCPYSELFWSVSSRIRTRKSPNTDTFYAVKSSIFSRIDYCNNLFIVLPKHQIRRMIKLKKFCASFAKCKFCSVENVVSIKWLLFPGRINFTVLEMTFKGLLNERMPSNFQINIKKKKKRELRESIKTI